MSQSQAPDTTVTSDEVLALGQEIERRLKLAQRLTWQQQDAIEKELSQKVADMDARAGTGLHVGRELAFPFADGYARYVIYEVGARSVKVIHIPLFDAWHDDNIVSPSGTVSKRVAEQNITRRDGMRRIFGGK